MMKTKEEGKKRYLIQEKLMINGNKYTLAHLNNVHTEENYNSNTSEDCVFRSRLSSSDQEIR